jgi:hypothetical protein
MGRADDALPVMIWTDALGGVTLGFHKNSLFRGFHPEGCRAGVRLHSLDGSPTDVVFNVDADIEVLEAGAEGMIATHGGLVGG